MVNGYREDKVANVRYNALKAIYEIKRNIKDKGFDDKARKIFNDMKADKDIDVAQIAIKYAAES